MAKFIWLLLLGLALVAEGNTTPKLKWPRKYTTQATRISLSSNLEEDYQIWRTKSKSRIDYNQGAVKSIVTMGKFSFGKKYDIHPEALLNQSTHTVCYWSSGLRGAALEDILPDIDDLEFVETEIINEKETSKFVSDVADSGIREKRTLWASYNSDKRYWSPVRYEFNQYNTDLGNRKENEIWEFYGFSTKFSSKSIFNIEYDCINKTKITMDSDVVTEHLVSINPDKDDHVDYVFNTFKKKYAKNYADDKEHVLRRTIFKNNIRLIVTTNRKNLGYKLSVNQFTDRTPEEMTKYMGLRSRPKGKTGNIPFPYTESKLKGLSIDLPKEYDARLSGLVSAVKNQETCGSCWTFGTTAAVEGALARINGGKLLTLANQALVDCAWAFDAGGCDGGSDNAAYEWMMEYGLPTEAEYGSYKNRDGVCNIKNMTKTYPIRGFTDVAPLGIDALKVALINHGPLSVSVHVTDAFSMYSSGIFYDIECEQTTLNHEVTVVGYGEMYGDTFWILKNSWGRTWGIDGYMHISARDNVCGVATEPTYVVF